MDAAFQPSTKISSMFRVVQQHEGERPERLQKAEDDNGDKTTIMDISNEQEREKRV